MKIGQVRFSGLQTEIGGGGKATVQQVHQNFLCGFEGSFLLPRFHQQLLGQHGFHRSENALRNCLQMLVQIHADEIAVPYAGADQRSEAPTKRRTRQINIVRLTGGNARVFADNRAGLVGDLSQLDGFVKQRIGKTVRLIMRQYVKGIVQHQQRAVHQLRILNGHAYQQIHS